jgi:hypothetical protein
MQQDDVGTFCNNGGKNENGIGIVELELKRLEKFSRRTLSRNEMLCDLNINMANWMESKNGRDKNEWKLELDGC